MYSPVPIRVISAARHNHSKAQLEKWFNDPFNTPVEITALCNTRRKRMSREYMQDVFLAILAGVKKVDTSEQIFFLVTGHPLFNMVAFFALREYLDRPFIVLVYVQPENKYEAYSSDQVLGWSQFAR